MRLTWLAESVFLSVVVSLALAVAGAGCGGDDGGAAIDAAVHDTAVAIDASAPDGGGTGSVCGGKAGLTCDAEHYCDHTDNGCGFDDGQGTCQPRPPDCPQGQTPTCGCDGTVYDSPCAAATAGVDVNDYNGCTPPLDTFRCGHLFCAAGTEYCQRGVSDVGGYADDWACVAIPAACNPGALDCACLADEPCGAWCTQDGTDFTLTCPGG
ncbi:MAG: hypothetical protein KC464_32440 [Myxococcales bacterium]|nr:hypothetical protein [Myxococcales bacterium]